MTAPDHDLLAEVKRALANATPGPWKRYHIIGRDGIVIVCAGSHEIEGGDRICRTEALRDWDDAHLIAHAPAWLAALVARVEELETLEARVRLASPIIADEIYGRMQETLAHDPAPALEQRAIGATAERKRIAMLARRWGDDSAHQGGASNAGAAAALHALADELEAGGEGGG